MPTLSPTGKCWNAEQSECRVVPDGGATRSSERQSIYPHGVLSPFFESTADRRAVDPGTIYNTQYHRVAATVVAVTRQKASSERFGIESPITGDCQSTAAHGPVSVQLLVVACRYE